MTIIEELKDYLNIQNPAGAVMINGKWGCGKTYLIEHELRDAVKDNCIILKVSLFGITDTETINNAIKKDWFAAWLNYTTGKDVADTGKKIKDFLKNMPFPDNVKNLVNIDPKDFVQMMNMIGKKRVVLVFDDLERCRMNIVDILGCINSYCENQGFHTIVIANEERIHDKKSGEVNASDLSDENTQLLYKEIKEKLILRTLYYNPDYEAIIESIINDILPQNTNNDNKYKDFIKDNSKMIASLAANAEYVFMNNIRCIKCALQDFSRVYSILYDYHIKDVENWLAPFFLFEAAVRNGIIKNKERQQVLSDIKELAKNDFNETYFIQGIIEWVAKGVWDSDAIKKEIEHVKEIQDLDNNYDKLRLGSILTLEDSVITKELDELVNNACTGELNFDDYLNLLRNILMLRKAGCELVSRDFDNRIIKGFKKCSERYEKHEFEDNCTIEVESLLENPEFLTEDEFNIIRNISITRENEKHKSNTEEYYCDTVSKGFVYLKNHYMGMRYTSITPKMVDVTVNAFITCSNKEKDDFCSIFNIIFGDLQSSSENITMLVQLLNKLNSLFSEYEAKKALIACYHTYILIKYGVELYDRINRFPISYAIPYDMMGVFERVSKPGLERSSKWIIKE